MCATCKNVTFDKFVSCSGMCNKVFHGSCIKVGNGTVQLLNSSTNLKWFCDECADIAGKLIRNMEDVMKMMLKISTDIKDINRDPPTLDRRITRSTKKNMVESLQKDGDGITSFSPTTAQSSHQLNSPVIIGTCNDAADLIKSAPERKFVYASKFANSTTIETLRSFLSGKLNVNEDVIDCRMLVSANQDITKYNFISFKIGVDSDMFQRLLQPDLWPSGVLVREFISRPKNIKPIVLAVD